MTTSEKYNKNSNNDNLRQSAENFHEMTKTSGNKQETPLSA